MPWGLIIHLTWGKRAHWAVTKWPPFCRWQFQTHFFFKKMVCILIWMSLKNLPMGLINNKSWLVNSLRPRRNGRYNADDIFKCIFLIENVWIPTIISLKFVPKGPINNIPALVQIMAWRPPGDKPLSEPMMVSLLTHICVTRPQWVKIMAWRQSGGKPLFYSATPSLIGWAHTVHRWPCI